MDGYYAATAENVASGAKFYIEATEGGYYLYTSADGGATKTYVNFVQSGNYTNIKYEASAKTVFVYDETLKTLKTTLGDKEYILGTRTDKTYKTLGPMVNDGEVYYAQFVLATETTTPDPTPDPEPEKPTIPQMEGAVAPEAGKAYNLGFVHGGLENAVYYLTGEMSGHYASTAEDVASGAKFYIEATEGGYYLYTSADGGATKTYVNFVQSDNYINIKYETTANTVFVYDETLNTMKAVLDENDYILATRVNKTYTTLGPMLYNGELYYAQFVLAAE